MPKHIPIATERMILKLEQRVFKLQQIAKVETRKTDCTAQGRKSEAPNQTDNPYQEQLQQIRALRGEQAGDFEES